MNSSWEATSLLANKALLSHIPDNIVTALRRGNTSQYLDAVSRLALGPAETSLVFTTHEDVFVELCSRWLSDLQFSGEWVQMLSVLAKVLPLAPYLSSYARSILQRHSVEVSRLFGLQRTTDLNESSYQSLHNDLLMTFRLLSFRNEEFASVVAPAQIQLMTNHPHRAVRYLAVRILCMYLGTSDELTKKLINDRVGHGCAINAPWEDKEIDYFFLDLWERSRIDQLRKGLEDTRAARNNRLGAPAAADIISVGDLSPRTACFGQVLIPRLEESPHSPSSLVVTRTVKQNMHMLAKAIRDTDNILVTGLPGAGKSSMIKDIARELCQSSSMITLHLNEQSDIKLLLGVYTSNESTGSFNWSPGVLTQAVLKGRWIVVEDIDRAPAEIMSALLPLLERGELYVPNRDESIRAAPGFKLIATVRSLVNSRGSIFVPGSVDIGHRHWTSVSITKPDETEIAEIIAHRYRTLQSYIPRVMGVYKRLRDLSDEDRSVKSSKQLIIRDFGLRDLLRWSKRLDLLLRAAGVCAGHEPISESTNDDIFLEAVDCLAGSVPSGILKAAIIEVIAQELQFPQERVKHLTEVRKPDFSCSSKLLSIGRATLKLQTCSEPIRTQSRGRPFAMTNDGLRTLESVCRALQAAEPCLLVGETGTGKTAIVQELAALTHAKLEVVNLSQQSEAGDLLGGYKPVSLRTLAIPLLEEFQELFRLTFSTKRNAAYIDNVAKAVEKHRWGRVVTYWQEALRMVDLAFGHVTKTVMNSEQDHPTKKRKVDSPKYLALMTRWGGFDSRVRVFQMHLASGSKGFAFSFVEGNIVKAARNGHWILLDEINLASPDTLESLAELLTDESDGGPSLLLAESGQSERIHAHKDFRVFGAMNPATDVGKRELPASLRSRFTEIFIDPPDNKMENLIPIIEGYLRGYCRVDRRAAADIASLFLAVKQLAERNAIVDGTHQRPHFSLRTLTRTLDYVTDIAPIYGLRRSLYEGFSMSFLTLLNAESGVEVLSLIEKYTVGIHVNGRASLKRVPRPPEDRKQYVQFKQYWMARGAQPIREQSHYILTPFVERNLLNLVRATSTRRFPVLLQGPTSSGKTSMIEFLANVTGNKFVRINNHEHTDIQEYLGTYVSNDSGNLQYHDGILVRALREGSWIVLDELNLAPSDVLEALNRLLDDNKELFIPETQEIIRPHNNFMLFATQNPPGIYGGRKVLSRAFRNRFLELHFDDIPEEELEIILRERCRIAPSFCTRIVAVYKRLSIIRQKDRLFEEKNSFATLRDLFRWASRDAADRDELAVNGFLLLAERVRDAKERSVVKRVIEEAMKVDIDEQQVYNARKAPDTSKSSTVLTSNTVWTNSILRLYILVTEALKHNEPVLLVGETGCGKTTMCQVIAEHLGKQLYVVNAHQNMEASDLIGSQRPVRNKAQSEIQLAQDLIEILQLSVEPSETSYDLPALLLAYDTRKENESLKVFPERRVSIERQRVGARALFEWADGSLVQAMRAGQHFLLDEISLADDSVLERLNSVLEPARTMFLAEKATESDPIVASDGFQLYATMNPGGDHGKKELSPALRNRFTEIWVPALSDNRELLEIASKKLATAYTLLAEPMITFSTWYNARYHPIAPSLSIRDLLSWVEFINRFGPFDEQLAVFGGAAMVYIDSLGADPTARTMISPGSIQDERYTCLSRLSELFGYNMAALYEQEPALVVDDDSLTIGPFQLKVQMKVMQDPTYSLSAPTTKMNVLKIVRALQMAKPILLEGSPGVGKTTLVSAIARTIGMPLTRINLSDQTDLTDLFGSDVPLEGAEAGHFGWYQAPFLKAMQQGEWVLLDEMNLASQSVLEGLNACLDHRGQVYIPELDETFSRHEHFVLFAAQNPGHQGGERKSLPASFVNRFTVVYVENFTSHDMLTICSQAFVDCSRKLIETLTQCIAAVNLYFQGNQTIGLRGGPWQFNLRDTFRWLELLTSRDGLMPAGNASDYFDILFLQRLRTLEDRVLLSALLEPFFPNERPARSRYLTLSEKFVQVGLGLLARNQHQLSPPAKTRFVQDVDLATMESIILCVQKNWPCLLVGPSGCGKTRVVNHLAQMIRAKVVTVALTAETDTIDLIGGYEQVDPQRRIQKIMKYLKELIREVLVEETSVGNAHASCIGLLVAHLQQPAPDLLQVTDCVRECALQLPMKRFGSLVEDLKEALQYAEANVTARFEWVDGILVNALTEGAWLILDNANLCSPAILDRLNSLLEPNGYLNINEHRSSDGTVRSIKPHPDFRLFLTMNSHHGELSRAMRNRSVELYLLSETGKERPNLMLEPSLARYALYDQFDWMSVSEQQCLELARICHDHLTFSDFALSTRWYEQVEKGLIRLPVKQRTQLLSTTKEYHCMLDNNRVLFETMKDYHQMFVRRLGNEISMLGFSSSQAIHPLNNPLLTRTVGGDSLAPNLLWFGSLFDFLFRLCNSRYLLQPLKNNPNTTSQISQLELAFSPRRTAGSETTATVERFIEEINDTLHKALSRQDLRLIDNYWLDSMNQILLYTEDLAEVMSKQYIHESDLTAYQIIGKSMIDNLSNHPTYRELTTSFCSALALFDQSAQLTSGVSMEIMWNIFRPPVLGEPLPSKLIREIDELLDKFDALVCISASSIDEVLALRKTMGQILDTINLSHVEPQGMLKDIREAMINYETTQGSAAEAKIAPLLHMTFRVLYQCSQIPANIWSIAPTLMDPVLSLLARQSTRSMTSNAGANRVSQAIDLLEKCTGATEPDTALAMFRDTLGITMLQELASSPEVHLGSSDMLYTELNLLANRTATLTTCFSNDQLRTVNAVLRQLHSDVVAAHQRFLEPSSLAQYRNFIPTLAEKPTADALRVVPQLKARSGLHNAQFLNHVLDKYLNPSLVMLCKTSQSKAGGQSSEETFATATAWIDFFTGCLVLYVPNRIFDPASKSLMDWNRHTKRKTELEAKLWALKTFEQTFTGLETNLRSQIVQSKLDALGQVPSVRSVRRPQESGLGKMQAVFDGVLEIIVRNSPTKEALEHLCLGLVSQKNNIKRLRSHIAQFSKRLSQEFKLYEDITRPLIKLLHGLDIGLAFALIAYDRAHHVDSNILAISRLTPFFGMGPDVLTMTRLDDLGRITPQIDLRLFYLHTVSAFLNTGPSLNGINIQTVFQVFHSFYQDWKEQLNSDQKDYASRSSLYRYRGGEDDQAGDDEQEFLQIFRSDSEEQEVRGNSANPRSDPRILSQDLAACQRKLLNEGQKGTQQILTALHHAADALGKLQQKVVICPIPVNEFLPMLILELDKYTNLQRGLPVNKKLYNFYTDTNVAESRKLATLLRSIKARYIELESTWPEHATIKDVIKVSSELLTTPHSQPIARLLPKTEQLHSFMHEWQSVASREFSTTPLNDALTSLLIDWRRTELSTWESLLDHEDARCSQDVDAWWFVAYEAIVAVPLATEDLAHLDDSHIENLLATLTEFLSTTSIGHYIHRLRLIAHFKDYVRLFAKELPAMKKVENVLINFLNFYQRFNNGIRTILKDGRQGLEKDMREILLRASWKDTNINALRESAKRSHHQLFKVIRKYRKLLAQPAQPHLQQSLPDPLEAIWVPGSYGLNPKVQDLRLAIHICQESLPSWASKPARFRDTIATAIQMAKESQIPVNSSDIVDYLDQHTQSLLESGKLLEQDALYTKTKETDGLAKHLKSRKRKLFVDTLRDIRRMGFQANINNSTLAEQETLSKILSNTPAFEQTQIHTLLATAEARLHQFLDLLFRIRQQKLAPSIAVSHTEVSRGFGYCESMLSTTLKQRAVLAPGFSEVDGLNQVIEQMENFSALDSLSMERGDNNNDQTSIECSTRISWLTLLLETACVLLEKHGRLGGSNNSGAIEWLSGWKEKTADLQKAYNSLPTLPEGIISRSHKQANNQAEVLFKQLNADLQQWTQDSPEIAFVFMQLERWTQSPPTRIRAERNCDTTIKLEFFDEGISKVSDSILVAIQRMKNALNNMPSDQDEGTYLTRSIKAILSASSSLQVAEVVQTLRTSMGQIQLLLGFDEGSRAAGAICAIALPIVQQYRYIIQKTLEQSVLYHRSLCKFASVFAQLFLQVLLQGFGDAVPSSTSEEKQIEKLEEGIGLGEGEGREDISKDVQDDEDLSEIAQQKDNGEKEDINSQDEAVEMNQDELEGDIGNASENEDEDGTRSAEDPEGLDEEVGDVGNLDPEAVDEKLWDGTPKPSKNDKQSEKSVGKHRDKEPLAAAAERESPVEDEVADSADEEAGEGEALVSGEMPKLSPHIQEEQNLDLPEEMDLDNDDRSIISELQGSDLEEGSNVSQEQQESNDQWQAEDEAELEDDPGPEIVPEESPTVPLEEENDPDAKRYPEDEDIPIDTETETKAPERNTDPIPAYAEDAVNDLENVVSRDTHGQSQCAEQQDSEDQAGQVGLQNEKRGKPETSKENNAQTASEEGHGLRANQRQDHRSEDGPAPEETAQSQAFKKLGDALERWHRQQQQVRDASKPIDEARPDPSDAQQAGEEFEHLYDEQAEADTQALGAAAEEQTQTMDSRAFDAGISEQPDEFPPDQADQDSSHGEVEMGKDTEALLPFLTDGKQGAEPRTFIGKNDRGQLEVVTQIHPDDPLVDELSPGSDDNSNKAIRPTGEVTVSARSPAEARQLWLHYESLTHALSIILTEQLRLILAPTQATKMRGDFRTGKRLNIKRIIPYIASNYKRDKIWMRRTVPQKRNYQVMLAVDDSKSMGESGSGHLALEALVLVAKSLSMLEVGEIAVVGFGEDVKVAQDFDKTLSAETGANIIQQFGFRQTKTNVRKLVAESLEMFRGARVKAPSSSAAELWQLMLIISDGLCEDHESIRRLVRQAQEERVMIVFVIVDAIRGESIVDMSQAVFEPDPDSEGGQKLKIKRYLDGFPFMYYLVVGNVRDLPGVLATALRQWFREVVGEGQ